MDEKELIENFLDNRSFRIFVEDLDIARNALGLLINSVKEECNREKAVQQFIGFDEGRTTNSIIALIMGMGLTKDEWCKIKKDYSLINCLQEDEIDSIDTYVIKELYKL